MLGKGINKRGEVIAEGTSSQDHNGHDSHHAAVHSILQSRRRRSSSRGRRGSSLSNSGSRLLGMVGLHDNASPSRVRRSAVSADDNDDADDNEVTGQAIEMPLPESANTDDNWPPPPHSPAVVVKGERKRGQSLSRKFLRRRGRSQQPQSSTTTDGVTRRSLSPSQHSHSEHVVRQEQTALPAEADASNDAISHASQASLLSPHSHSSLKVNLICQEQASALSLEAETYIKNPAEDANNASQASLLSAYEFKKASQSVSSNKRGKKSLWGIMKQGWKKNKDHGREHENDGIQSEVKSQDTANSAALFSQTRRATPPTNPDESFRSGATSASTAPPSPPAGTHWDTTPLQEDNTDDNINDDDNDDYESDNDEYESGNNDDPWNPTMSLLLKTGQLDCIESDSEEDLEKSSIHIMNCTDSSNGSHEYDTDTNNEPGKGRDYDKNRAIDDSDRSSKGYDLDAFMGMNDFCNQVASTYLTTKQSWEGGDDRSRNCDESTLSKEDTVASNPNNNKQDKGRGKSKNSKQQASPSAGVNDEKENKTRRNLSIRSFSESIVRRGRSRGRPSEMKDDKNNKGDEDMIETASVAASSTADSNTENIPSSSSGGRSRSLFRRRHMNIHRKNTSENQQSNTPRRGSSVDMNTNNRNGSSRSRYSKSLPRQKSQSFGVGNDEHASLSSSTSTRSKRKKCLVCHQQIPWGEGIRYMDFHFCSFNGEYGSSCFQCLLCHESLEGELAEIKSGVGDLQIISNARGSIVQCSKCAIAMMARLAPQTEAATSHDEGDEEERSCLRLSIQIDESFDDADDDDGNDTSSDGEADNYPGVSADYANHLTRATKRLAKKGLIKLTLANDDTDTNEKEYLSQLYFTQNEDDRYQQSKYSKQAATNTTKVLYELDSDAFGNPNYDGYQCSINDFDDSDHNHDTPRMTTVALPKLDSDEIDGTISSKLDVELVWLDEDGESYSSSGSDSNSHDDGSGYIHPERSGPAMLSIEQFKSETMTEETVMKVLRQTWDYQDENNNVTYQITCVVPFKKIYISWEIDDGDELDLAQCQLEVQVRYDPPEPEVEETALTESVSETLVDVGTKTEASETCKLQSDAAIPMVTSTVNNEHVANDDDYDDNSLDDHSMPNAVYVKTMSIETASTSGLCLSSLILSRAKEALDPDREQNSNFSELLSVASCVNSTIALPSITYLKIEKKEFDEEIGLSLLEKNGATIVAEMSKSGLFADTQIKEGCEILAINGQCVRTPRSFIRIMKDCVGKVTIMMSDSPSPPGSRFVVKKHKSTGFGRLAEESEDITLGEVNGLVRVQDIAADGVFIGSPISKGDICLSVDGVPAVSDGVATRALGRSQSIVAMLVFSLPGFWKSLVEFIIDEKYNRWWKKDTQCILLWGNEDCTPITLTFDEQTGLCKADDNEENEIDLKYMNIIISRVMKLLTESIKAYRSAPKKGVRGSSRSLSVSAPGQMKNRSDVYRRALIKLDEMKENGTLSAKDYEAGKRALAQVAIQTAT